MLSNYFDKHVKRTSVRNTENLNSELSAHPARPKGLSDKKQSVGRRRKIGPENLNWRRDFVSEVLLNALS